MPNAAGWQRHIGFKKEATWGTAVTPDIYLPVETYDVVAVPEFYVGDPFAGLRQRKHDQEFKNTFLRGTMAGDLYGYQVTSGSLASIAEHLISLATSAPAGHDLDSATIIAADPNDGANAGVEHDGMRINSLTISGDADTGPIKYSATWEGQTETGDVAPLAIPAASSRRPMMFRDATFQLGGVSASLRSFSLTLNNNLIVKHNNGQWPAVIAAGPRTVEFGFSLFKTDATYDALRRGTTATDRTAQIVIKGDHQGTATNTFTTITIDIDLSQFASAADQISRADLWEQSANYVVIKSDTSDNDIDITYSTAA